MIHDSLSNAGLYTGSFGWISEAADYVNGLTRRIKDGRYDIRGDDMFALISTYRTKRGSALPFEAHRKYIDLQCLISGEERIDVAQGEGFRIKDRYSARSDVLFIHPPKAHSSISLSSGQFCILFPHDYHRPGQSIKTAKEVRKLVIKVRAK